MSDVTRLLRAIDQGDSGASAALLPIVYDELRRLARARMANERAEHTLDATALVHEAYLRLIGNGDVQWEGQGHFYAAAAEAMRRILIEHARGKNAQKRGGLHRRLGEEVGLGMALAEPPLEDLLALDEALNELAADQPAKAELVKLRYFAGLTLEESAAAMNVSLATVKRHWTYSRAWLYERLNPGG